MVAVTSNPSALQLPGSWRNFSASDPRRGRQSWHLRFASEKLRNSKRIVLAAVSKES